MLYQNYLVALLCVCCLLGCSAAEKNLEAKIAIQKDEASAHPAKIIFFFAKTQKAYEEQLKQKTADELYDKFTEATTQAPPEADVEKEITAFKLEVVDKTGKTRDIAYKYEAGDKDVVAVIYTFSYTENEEFQLQFTMDEKYKWGLLCTYPKETQPQEISQDVGTVELSCSYAEGIKVNMVKPQ